MSDIKEFVYTIKNSRLQNRHVTSIMELPEQDAQHKKIQPDLPAQLKKYLSPQKMKLYSHQAEVIQKAREGKNIVLVTATASGKTMAFNLPVFERLLQDSQGTALYLYPMKALAYDQLKEIKEMEQKIGINTRASVYDGDTPKSSRPKIRQQSRIVLSNPHAFHWYLAWHKLWKNFFINLKFIVIDEGHWYKGIYGTNVAFLLRRLQRILKYYGSDPQFIMASATMADPQEHACKLVGKEFDLVKNDGSVRGRKTFIFWDTGKTPDKSPHLQTAELFASCVKMNMQTLCFTVSRKMAELTAHWAGQSAEGISSYRSGYLPEERRELERDLKEGRLKGIASTNALELGVNIGGLDAVVIGGYPGTITSFHQRAGRAGRSGREALVLQLLYDNPLDSYILSHPNYLFKEPIEQAVISLENKNILSKHLLCAAEELPLGRDDESWFGRKYGETASELVQEGSLIQKPKTARSPQGKENYVFAGKGACFGVNLSSFDNEEYRLVCNNKVLEVLNKRQAYLEAHPGAVFMHRTKPYRVTDFNEGKKIINVQPLDKDLYTTALSETYVKANMVVKEQKIGEVTLKYGNVTVTEIVSGYMLKKFDKVVSRHEITMNPIKFDTAAIWFELPLSGFKGDLAGGLHAAEHLLIAVTPLLAMCDRWDIGGVSLLEKSRGVVFIYDGFPGGIGISERLFNHFGDLVDKAGEIVEKCKCGDGCPRCIISPKCGNNNEPLDKGISIKILKALHNNIVRDAL